MRRPAWVEPILQHAAYGGRRVAVSVSNRHHLLDTHRLRSEIGVKRPVYKLAITFLARNPSRNTYSASFRKLFCFSTRLCIMAKI